MTKLSAYADKQTDHSGQRAVAPKVHPLSDDLRAREIHALIADARGRNRGALDELSGKRILAAYGIDVPRSVRIDDVEQLADAIGNLAPPLVVKVISSEILHKSDVGGVCLNLNDVDSVRQAMNSMRDKVRSHGHRIDGYLIEEMIPLAHNVVIGGVRDSNFGQVVMFGLGGVFVEVLRDVSFRICPITRTDAGEMIRELRGAPILAGARGGVAVPESILIDTLMAVGGADGLLLALGDDLRELDINPVIVSDTRAVAVDARFVLTE